MREDVEWEQKNRTENAFGFLAFVLWKPVALGGTTTITRNPP
jgi:hypothetical protein